MADDEDIAFSGCEGVVDGIFDVDDIESSVMSLTVGDHTDTAHVATTDNHGDGAGIELDEVGDLTCGEVDLDSVVDFDYRIWVSNAKFWPGLISISWLWDLVFPTKLWSND